MLFKESAEANVFGSSSAGVCGGLAECSEGGRPAAAKGLLDAVVEEDVEKGFEDPEPIENGFVDPVPAEGFAPNNDSPI